MSKKIVIRLPRFAHKVAGLAHNKDGFGRLALGVGIGIAILIITFWYIGLFIKLDLVIRWSVALLITSVIYFPLVFPHVTIEVPPNKGWILANRFRPETSEINLRTGFREIHSQSEKQASLKWKYPWERFSEEVDMKKEIPVRGNDKEAYTLADKTILNLEYQIPVFPLPGYLVNFVKMKEEDIKRRVQTRAERNLQEFVGKLSEKDVSFSEIFLNKLQKHFENVFGGPHHLDEEEKAMGIWTGTPEIFDVNQPPQVQEGKVFQQRMQSVIEIANEMVTKSGGELQWGEAYRIAYTTQAANTGKLDFVEVAGLMGLAGARPPKAGNKNNPRKK